ncbi:MAG: FtsQ-type POTRA domain-containing protein [Pseudolabrys sp.]|nr:FtsQ-type POTRA domain-containing protein [Pseudolabrys sp.]
MDRRGYLAQLLTDPPERPAAPGRRRRPQVWAPSRWQRQLRRWFSALVDIEVPGGAGSAAVALLLLASVCYGVVKGGHGPTIAANVGYLCDDIANAAGFGISEVALAGEHEVSRDEILKTAGITERSSLLFLDAAEARARLMTNPWIVEATILKLYPGRLRIEIEERKAFALWQKDARISLIAADGTVLEPYVPRGFATLPRVVGEGAEHRSSELLALVARYPAIARQVEASVLVAERRWNLHLKNGVEVLLPENAPDQALKTLAELERDKQLLSRDIVMVDLRLTDRVTVRQSDAAAAARDEALKAADKIKKKAKGSEA